jgi:GT2 family glycosyltransferase
VDGSSDGTLEMLKDEFPNADIILGNGNWWYTKCINKGIERAIEINSTFIITLNDDIEFHDNYIFSLLKIANLNKEKTLVGSISLTQSIPHRITFSGIKSLIRWRLKYKEYINKFSIIELENLNGFFPSICLSGRGMLFHKQIIFDIGMYDQKFVQYGSDSDFSYRAYKKGYNVVVSYDAKVYENEKLTSSGIAFNKPGFINYYYSFFNIHSSNSLYMSSRFYYLHGYKILFPIYFLFKIVGSLYNLYFKYR